MALVTYQMLVNKEMHTGSYAAYPSRLVSWNKGIELKKLTTPHIGVNTEKIFSQRCKSCLRVGVPLVCGPKATSLRISAFKGNDESGGRARGSRSSKNSVKLSYVLQKSEDTSTESPNMQDDSLSCASEADERIAGSLAIPYLFRNRLSLLHSKPPNQIVGESLEGPDSGNISVMQNVTQKKQRGQILKAVCGYFWGLDATIKIPLLVFTPAYLAVNVVYGAEVSKELMPLWVLGPLSVAVYIKMLRALCALYVFTFKQTVKTGREFPTYFRACGKLIHAHLWQPVVDIKNLDYKEFSKRKLKEVELRAVEKYLNYVESIWPYYCRSIRFLKRAFLI